VVDHNRVQALAGLGSADVVVVNPIADGMNLVAKEAALVNKRDAVLVLSKTAGASMELGPFAINIDPFDTTQTAGSLFAALTFDPEARHRRAQALRATVMRNDLGKWFAALLAEMEQGHQVSGESPADVSELCRPEAETSERPSQIVLASDEPLVERAMRSALARVSR
jgi:trehalose 6-phosphate synthase